MICGAVWVLFLEAMCRTSAGTNSRVCALVKPDAGVGWRAGGLSRWVSASAEIAFGEGAALFRRSGRWFYAGGRGAGDGSREYGDQRTVGSPADSGWVLRSASAGAYAGTALSFWRRDTR